MSVKNDISILRGLAKKVAEIAAKDIQEERRELWRRHNNLEHVRPPIYVRAGGWQDELITPKLQCKDEFYRQHESFLRFMIFQDTIGDDYVIEPFITQRASYILPKEGAWGVRVVRQESDREGGASKYDHPIKVLSDIEKLKIPSHRIDEARTKADVERIGNAIGDILEINVDRAPFYSMWSGDISTDLGYLRGIEQIMWDMMDHPQWLHRLLAFMRDGILKVHREAEDKGDWQLANHQNQSMPYAKGLKAPKANSGAVKRNELWGFLAAQELTLISPEHHDEFMLQYQKPILEHFAMVSYGCCEDLTKKIPILRQIKNLRRIAVSPFADVAACAEQIGQDYVCSWRPNPAETVCLGFDEAHIKQLIEGEMVKIRANNSIVDICLKDVHTVQGDAERLSGFVKIVREVVE